MAFTNNDFDTKILEMRFNNEQFERNIQKSTESIEQFETTLANLRSGKAFDELSKAADKIDLSGIEDSILSIEDKFSALGIAGMTVAYRLTNSFINLGKTIWGSTIGQIKSGGWARALNIQQAEHLFRGMKLDAEQLKDDAMYAVKDTAYGFDEAARTAANLATTGIKAGDDMKNTLLGISGVAAMTNTSFLEIADIYTKIAATGRLTSVYLDSFNVRGLNALDALSKKLKTTQSAVKEMVSKGKIDFKTFAEAMEEAYGAHAKDANKTFEGSLSNIKAALSRIGEDFASPIVNDTVPALNALNAAIDKIREDMTPVINLFADWSRIISTVFTNFFNKVEESKTFFNIFHGLEHIFMGLITVLYAVKKGFQEAFPQMDGLSDAFRRLTFYLMPTEEGFNGLVNIFKIFFSTIKMVVDAVKVGANIFLSFAAVGYKALSILLGFMAGISDLIDPYIQWIKENNIIENLLYAVISAVYDLIMGSELLKNSFSALVNNGGSILNFLSNLVTTVFNFGKYIFSLVSTLDLGTVGIIAFLVTVVFSIEAISMFVNRLIMTFGGWLYTVWNIFKQIGNMFLGLSRVFNMVAKMFEMSAYQILGTMILEIAAAIFILAISLKLLTTVSTGDLVKAGVALAALAGGLVLIAWAFKSLYGANILQDVFSTATFTAAMLAIVAGISVLALVLKIVSTIKQEDIAHSIVAMYAIGALLLIMNKVMSFKMTIFEGLSQFVNAANIAVFASAILTVSLALRLLAAADKNLGAATAALLAIGTLLIAVAQFTSITVANKPPNPKYFNSLAASLLVMAIAVRILAGLDDNQLGQALLAMGFLATLLMYVSWVQKQVNISGVSTDGFLKLAATLTILTGCLTILALLGSLPNDALIMGIAALFALETAVTAMIIVSTLAKGNGINIEGLLVFSAAMAILSIAIATIVKATGDNYGGLVASVVAIGVLMVLVWMFQLMSHGLEDIHTFGFLTLSSAILIISGAMAMLAMIPDPIKLLAAAGAIASIIIALSVAAKLAQNFTIVAGTGLLIFASGILVLAGALAIISSIPLENLVGTSFVIIILGNAFLALAKAIQAVPVYAAATLVVLSAGLVLMAGALYIMAQVPWPSILIGAGAIAILVIALSAAGQIAQYAAQGLVILSGALLSLGLTMLMFGLSVKMVAEGFYIFTEALHNLAELSTTDVNNIINNLNTFILGLGTVCDSIVAMSPKFALAFLALGIAASAAIGAVVIAVSSYAVLGMILFAALLVKSLPALLEAFSQIMDAVGVWFEENGDKVYEFGRQLGHAFSDGILGAVEGLAEAIYDKIWGKDVQEAKDQWKQIGQEAGNTYRENMLKGMDMYKNGEYSSEQLILGLKTGLQNGYMTEEEVMRELANRGLEGFKDELGIHSPSLEMIRNGEYTIQGVIEGVKSKEYTFEEAMGAMAEGGIKAFQNKFDSTDLISSITGSLGITGGVGKSGEWYDKGSQILGGKYRYQLEGYSNIDDYVEAMQRRERQAMYDSIKKEIFDDLGLDANGIDEATDAINNNTNALGDYSTAAGTASKQTDELKKSIKETLSVFDTFNDTVSTTGRQVLYSFMTEIQGVTKWSSELEALSARGLNANFIMELADKGPEAYDKIHALYSMTEQELTLFNKMYAQKIGIQRNTANQIRKTFVKNGVMLADEAEKLAKDTGDVYDDAVKEAGDSTSKTAKKAVEDAYAEIEKAVIDDKFLEEWSKEIASSQSKLTMSEAFSELGLASMEAFQQSTNFEVIFDKLILFKNGIKDQVKSSLKLFDEVKVKTDKELKEEEISTTQMLYNMAENTKKIGKWARNLRELAARGMSEGLLEELRQLGPESADKVDAFVRMTADELKRANSLYESSTNLPEYVADKMTSTYAKAGFATALGLKKGLDEGKDDLLFAYQETGEEAAEGFVKGINPDAAKEAMTYLGENSLGHLKTALDSHSPSKKMEEIGKDATKGFNDGIDAQIGVRDSVYGLGGVILETFNKIIGFEKFKDLGMQCIRGLHAGFNQNVSMVRNAVSLVASNVLSAFTGKLKIESPSKEFAWCADMCSLGFVNAFSNDTAMETATDEKADDILTTMATKLQALGMVDTDDIYEPVIRPVWDMSAVENGFTSIDSYLTNNPMNLNGTIDRANAASKTGGSQDAISITTAINGLKTELQTLRSINEAQRTEIFNLKDAISNMYVRMDGGALVGQIVNPLDSAMGARVVKQKRGRV